MAIIGIKGALTQGVGQGPDSLAMPTIPQPPTAPELKEYRHTIVNRSTGERLGYDGEQRKWIKLPPKFERTVVDKETGERKGFTGKAWVDLKPEAPSYIPGTVTKEFMESESPLFDAGTRLLGVALGTANAGYSAFWGYQKGYWGTSGGERERMKGGGKEAYRSFVDSSVKKGSWGTTYVDYFEASTGRKPQEYVRDWAKDIKDPTLRKGALFLADCTDTTIELLVSFASDMAITIPAAIRAYKGILAPYMKIGRGGKIEVKGVEHLSEEQLKAVREGIQLLEKREELLGVLARIRKDKGFQGTAARLRKGAESEAKTKILGDALEAFKGTYRGGARPAEEAVRSTEELSRMMEGLAKREKPAPITPAKVAAKVPAEEPGPIQDLVEVAVKEIVPKKKVKPVPVPKKGIAAELLKVVDEAKTELGGLDSLRALAEERMVGMEKVETKRVIGTYLPKAERRLRARGLPEGAVKVVPKAGTPKVEVSKGKIYVQRYEEKGIKPTSVDKPQGLYTSPIELDSPHKDLGGERAIYEWHPKNVLDVTGELLVVTHHRRGLYTGQEIPASSGIKALKSLVGDKEFNHLLKISKQELTTKLTKRYPNIQWKRYHDGYEMLEGYAGKLAREKGYDAIIDETKQLAVGDLFAERVALEKSAITKVSKMGKEPVPTEPLIEAGPAAKIDHLSTIEASRIRTAGKGGKVQDKELASLIEEIRKESPAEAKVLSEEAKKQKRVYQDLMDLEAERAGFGKARSETVIEKEFEDLPEELTFDSMGGQQIVEGIGRLAKRFKRRKIQSEEIQHQVGDVIGEVGRTMRQAFKANNYQPKLGVEELMRQEARSAKYSMRSVGMDTAAYKRKMRWSLTKDKKTRYYKDLDGVNKALGTGTETAKEYRDALHDLLLHDYSAMAEDAFVRAYFPEGLETVTLDEALNAAVKYESLLKRGPEKAMIRPKRFESADISLGRVPSGRAFYRLVMKDAKDEKGLLVAKNWRDLMDVIKRRGVKEGDLNDLRLTLDSKPIFDPNTWKVVRDKEGYRQYESMAGMAKSGPAKAATEESRTILDGLYKAAKGSGVDVKGYIKAGYFPHRIPPADSLVAGGAKRAGILKATVEEGWFRNSAEAETMLDAFISRARGNLSNERYLDWMVERGMVDNLAQAREWWSRFKHKRYDAVYGSLGHARTANCPFYDRDFLGSMASYVEGVSGTIANYRVLGGEKAPKAYRLIQLIKAEKGNHELAEELITRHMIPSSISAMPNWVGYLKGYHALTKLGPISSLKNTTQALAPLLRTDIQPWFRAWRQLDREGARRAGVALNQTIRDVERLHAGVGLAGKSRYGEKFARGVSGYMHAIQFIRSERLVRDFAGNCGKQAAIGYFNLLKQGKRTRFCKRFFHEVGMDSNKLLKRGYITDHELNLIQKRISDEVNFLGTDVDMPLKWVDDPVYNLATQFKTFPYGQAKLVYRHVFKEAGRGNFRPLLYLATVYPAAGTVVDKVLNQWLLGFEKPNSALEQYLRGLTAVAGLGIMETTLFAIEYGKVAESAAGPTGAEIGDVATKIWHNAFDPKKEFMRRMLFDIGDVYRGIERREGKGGRTRPRRSGR